MQNFIMSRHQCTSERGVGRETDRRGRTASLGLTHNFVTLNGNSGFQNQFADMQYGTLQSSARLVEYSPEVLTTC